MKKLKQISITIILNVMSSCVTNYSTIAYENAKRGKQEFLKIADLATESYSIHKSKIDSIKIDLKKSYEFEQQREKNHATVWQWKILMAKNGTIYGFFNLWEKKDSLNTDPIKFIKKDAAATFDEILKLEKAKQ